MPTKAKDTPKIAKVVDVLNLPTSTTPKLVPSKTFPPPSTPATRLPLADLVGNEDDSRRHVPNTVVSPEEQLCWRGSQPVNTPQPRIKRKRARSSSPVGASQEELHIGSIRKDLCTPVADPATELWARYTNNKDTPTTKKAVAFAHLINDSSPQASANTGSVSGLRRWASCGTEFPTSATKRRRTKGAFKMGQNPPGDVFDAPSSDSVFQVPPEKSKLADMVQRMRDSIPKRQSKMSSSAIPSSSSPLPDVVERHNPPSDSPLQQRHARGQAYAPSQSLGEEMEVIQEETYQDENYQQGETYQQDHTYQQDETSQQGQTFQEAALQQPPPGSLGSSDEFGDDDFDTDMVEALEITQGTTGLPEGALSVPTEPINPPPEVQPRQQEISAPSAAVDSDDEFGLDDDEGFAADLEQVSSLYDRSANEENQSLPQDARQDSLMNNDVAPVIDLIEDDSDEFGDDIDADEFAAAEVVATQGGGNVCRPQSNFV